jgi:hypothetical protein
VNTKKDARHFLGSDVMASIYQQSAFVRWPIASSRGNVYGDGRFALANVCTQTVRLFESFEKAKRKQIALDHRCGSSSCNGDHKIIDLEISQ